MAPVPFASPILITRPTLPPIELFEAHLKEIWSSRVLTNQGPKHMQLEKNLTTMLGTRNVRLFSNGTLALILGVKALGIRGEVITTPFTFPATPHSLVWAGATPVFCDIDPVSLCIDPNRIEALITPRTEAILGVHVYGIPCDADAIQAIASKHGLKVIYDAAHAFLTEVRGIPIASFGDMTMFSFHATKLFHTIEGGCLAFNNSELGEVTNLLKNFGIKDGEAVLIPGMNAKMSEIQCAMGIEMLKETEVERERRKPLRRKYLELLSEIEGIDCVVLPDGISDSLQYMALRVDEERFGLSRDQLQRGLTTFNVFSRKYFFPLCTDYECYKEAVNDGTPIARRAADQLLCLPFYGDLEMEAIERIVEMIAYLGKNGTIS
ncbi:dTDP-4-amino-4,6-dideoxygalactose transaminase [Nitrosospira multiformis]|uniref:dTDP-4-amino-4,6-dideoxygalactose transaminase n=2 Tax=Nitrosospira multiformis TaxID=1231 RepID=A0A1I7I7R8_9PROT|nr:dTDP-4-amino-4,6-dideoxygalactose transaminase [Nitrosospira multiformis]